MELREIDPGMYDEHVMRQPLSLSYYNHTKLHTLLDTRVLKIFVDMKQLEVLIMKLQSMHTTVPEAVTHLYN